MTADIVWLPPGKNCGLCGQSSCTSFIQAVSTKNKELADCPYYHESSSSSNTTVNDNTLNNRPVPPPVPFGVCSKPNSQPSGSNNQALRELGIEQRSIYPGRDILGNSYDFILQPLPGEISARKIVLPFRSDLPEKLQLKKGDIVIGRPTGAGCPVQHVLQIITAEYHTGLLTTWAVGPRYSRDRIIGKDVHDLGSYHMIGFEGTACQIYRQPKIGQRHNFLPGFCMMSLNHSGLANMLLNKSSGLHIRLENIIIQ